MPRTLLFASSFLSGRAFTASATFNGQSDTISIANWGGGGGGDTTPPVLSSASAVTAGSSGGVGSVTTDEGGGTLYWVVTTSGTTPSVGQIKAGQSHTGSSADAAGAQSVLSTGQQTTSPPASGLQQSTSYRFHFVQTDLAGNDSTPVTSGTFTTDAQGSGTGSVAIAIPRRMSLSEAPEAVWMRATVSDSEVSVGNPNGGYDESWNDAVYVWSFGDAQQSTNGTNLPSIFNDLSQGGGREVCHVYTAPGTFGVTCDAYRLDGTYIGRGTASVTVTAPSYPGDNTILVDASGSGDNTTYPGSQVFTTFAAAVSAAKSTSGAVRILGRRGDTYSISSEQSFSGENAHVYLGAWGSGAMPRLRSSGISSGGTMVDLRSGISGDIRIENWDIEGTWDPTTETGTPISCIATFQHNSRNVLVTRCRLANGTRGFFCSDNGSVSGTPMFVNHDNEIMGWLDYGMYCGRNQEGSGNGQYYAIIGGAIYQDPNAMMGGNGKTGQDNQHGPVRVSVGHNVYIDGVDFFSRNSWPTSGTVPGIQPQIRFMTNNNYNDGYITSGVIRRCACEASADMITCTSAGEVSGYSVGSAPNLLIENIYAIGSSHTANFLNTEFGGVTVRNCIHVVPDIAKGSGSNNSDFITFADAEGGVSYPGASWPFRAYNNTMVDYRASGTYGGGSKDFNTTPDSGNIASVTLANNLHWCPNDTGQSDTGSNPLFENVPMPTIGGAHTPRFLGWKWDTSPTMDTSKATPASIADEYKLGTGSPALGTASGTTSPFDIAGNPRGSNGDQGAWQVSA